jgi:L-asparaginase
MGVLLIACGGTIASRSSPAGVSVSLSGEELLAAAGLDGVDVVDAARGPSWSFDAAAVEGIARTVVAAAASGDHDGVVVTHGTDTVEETSFLTWLLGGAAASERCPIVFTAAMHHADHDSPDGPRNLREAVALAETGTGGRPGPVLRIDGSTHHARWVTKTDTSSLDTFRSPGASATPPSPPPHGDRVEPAVAQVHAHTGVAEGLVDWHLDRGVRGLVVEGTGAGNVNGALVGGVERAVAGGVPVVLTSRCWTGSVSPTYGGPGGGASLAALGCIGGGDLPTHKARLALSVALGVDPDPDAARAWFRALVG